MEFLMYQIKNLMPRNSRKGQAAMEFLMTYGWAILVVIVVLGVLATYGVFDVDTFIPERCNLPVDLNCKDHRLSSDASSNGEIKLLIENGKGNDIYIMNITAVSTDFLGANCSTNLTAEVLVKNGQTADLTVNVSSADRDINCSIDESYRGSAKKTKWDVYVEWYFSGSDSDYAHKTIGELIAKIEP